MILLIDNYDSFSYNLYQLIGSIDPDIRVIRNDEMTIAEIEALAPERIILSPGPGKPANAGICEEVVRQFGGKIPILGVCLGHQAICEVWGNRNLRETADARETVCGRTGYRLSFVRGTGRPDPGSAVSLSGSGAGYDPGLSAGCGRHGRRGSDGSTA